MTWQIAPLEERDAQAAITHLVSCFGEAYRGYAEEDVGAALVSSPYQPFMFVAKDADRIIGMVSSSFSSMYPRVQCFSWLSVKEDHRKQGLGAALLKTVEQHAIENFFKDHAGSFMLASVINPDYYRHFGYEGSLLTHDGAPFMIKHYKP